ncbi:MAG: Zn-binding domain-containing protein, partial [Candidatus Saccharibacteria bacterium]
VSTAEAGIDAEAVDILQFLEENRYLHFVDDKFYWVAESFPAHEVSLRSVAGESVAIIDETEASPRVVGEMDRSSAMTMLYEGAIYLHQDEQYQVTRFDWDGCRAYVKKVEVDYYTDADLAVDLKVLEVFREDDAGCTIKKWGEVMVTQVPTVFKKIKYRTHENIGWGPIKLPEEEMHTSGFWVGFKPEALQDLTNEQKEYALVGIANLYQNLASIFLMCDTQDIRVVPQIKAVESDLPTIFIYDSYPGGTGLAEGLYTREREVMWAAFELASACGCRDGCPSCVGPPQLIGEGTRKTVVNILSSCLR